MNNWTEKLEPIDIFIPAQALEHRSNSEDMNRLKKIEKAVVRFLYGGSFEAEPEENLFKEMRLVVKECRLATEPLGYKVRGNIIRYV